MSDRFELKQLYDQASAAFQHAQSIAAENPQPGTEDWLKWQYTALAAAAANDKFVWIRDSENARAGEVGRQDGQALGSPHVCGWSPSNAPETADR